METKNRSTAAQKIIKDKVGKFFSEEQLSYLDDLGIEILNDYFSNHELRELQDATATVIKGFVDRNQKNEVKRRLTHIGEDELDSLIDWYKENCSEIEEVYDPQAEMVIALEVKHKTLQNSPKVHWDGRFVVAIGDRLAATRTRLDGVMGYQSSMTVQDPAFVEEWSKYHDARQKKFEQYRKVIDKAKAAHQKKVDAARKKYDVALDKYNKAVLASYELKSKVKTSSLKPPVLEVPEYIAPDVEFEEPEKPTISQHLPPLDTRWSEPETAVVAEDHIMSSITNDDIINVRRHMDSSGYKKPVTKVADGYKVDGFILRKVQ